MELDELLDREGLDPDELMTWAHTRAEQLLAELTTGAAGGSDELARLLEPAGQIDLDGVPVRRVAVAQDMLPTGVGTRTTGQVEAEDDESITVPISIDEAGAEQEPSEPAAAELGTRGRRRVPSAPQPLSASELPPPPEHPRFAEGEPEPVLETVDTGPIDLATAEARAMITANSTHTPESEPESESAGEVSEAVTAEAAPQVAVEAAAASDEPQAAAAQADDETDASETDASEAEAEADASEADASEADASEADASEADASEADASETDASETDASDEFEIDELEEIDDEELELLVDVDDSGDAAEVPPPPPPRPPPSKPAAAPPPKPIDNEVDMDDLIAGLANSDR